MEAKKHGDTHCPAAPQRSSNLTVRVLSMGLGSFDCEWIADYLDADARLGWLKSLELEGVSTGYLYNKALNRSVVRRQGGLVVGWSWPPIVSDSVFTNLHFSSARLTRALSCGAIARRRTAEMQRHAVGCVMKCGSMQPTCATIRDKAASTN